LLLLLYTVSPGLACTCTAWGTALQGMVMPPGVVHQPYMFMEHLKVCIPNSSVPVGYRRVCTRFLMVGDQASSTGEWSQAACWGGC
jgi:hypothetical protein